MTEQAERAGGDQRRAGQDDDARRPALAKGREHPQTARLQDREDGDQRPGDRLAGREPPKRGQPARVNGDNERVVARRASKAPR
jgi:hypothetical protein